MTKTQDQKLEAAQRHADTMSDIHGWNSAQAYNARHKVRVLLDEPEKLEKRRAAAGLDKKDHPFNVSRYGWVIEWTANDEGRPDRIKGPYNIGDNLSVRLDDGEGASVALLDADGIVLATGRIVGDFIGDEPKKDWGAAAVGCVAVQLAGEKL